MIIRLAMIRLGPILARLEPMIIRHGPILTRLGPMIIRHGPILTRLRLLPNMARLEPMMIRLGPILTRLGPMIIRLGPILTRLGPMIIRLGPIRTQLRLLLILARLEPMIRLGPMTRLGPMIIRLGPILTRHTTQSDIFYASCSRCIFSLTFYQIIVCLVLFTKLFYYFVNYPRANFVREVDLGGVAGISSLDECTVYFRHVVALWYMYHCSS